MKRFPWFELLLFCVVMSIHIYAATSDAYNLPNRWFDRDDAYYYFKVAQNIAEGRGVTFDGINPANGFHPLWMLICIPIFALAHFDHILPLRVLLVVMGVIHAATGVFIFRLLLRAVSMPIAMVAAAFWVFSPYIHASLIQLGLESGITAFSLALLLLFLERFERRRKLSPLALKELILLGMLAVFVLFSRLDTIFLLILIGLWVVFREMPLRVLLLADLLILVAAPPLGLIVRLGVQGYYSYREFALGMIVLNLLIHPLLYYFWGLYRSPQAVNLQEYALRLLFAVGLASLLAGIGMFALRKWGMFTGFSRSALLLNAGFVLLFVGAWRVLLWLWGHAHSLPSSQKPSQALLMRWREWLREGMAFFATLAIPLILYMLWNKLAFDTFMPVSGQIKRWWGSLPGRVYGGPARSLSAFFGFDAWGDFNAWAPLTSFLGTWSEVLARRLRIGTEEAYLAWIGALLFGILIAFFLSRRRAAQGLVRLSLPPLIAGGFLHVLSYNVTGYASVKEWYWAPQMLTLVLLFALVAEIVLHRIWESMGGKCALSILALLICGLMGWRFLHRVIVTMPHTGVAASPPYMDVAAFLEANTENGALIGMTGGGNVGYFIRGRTIVNMDGLINSAAYFEALKNGRAGEYLEKMGLDYVFANPAILENIPYKGQFTGRLEPVASYGQKMLMRYLPIFGE